MNAHTRDLIALVSSVVFTVTVCLLICWHVVNGQTLDGNDLTLVAVLIALIAATTGIQLPGVITRVNGGGNAETYQTTTTTTKTSLPKTPGSTPPSGTDPEPPTAPTPS